jgi:hypothetical protein
MRTELKINFSFEINGLTLCEAPKYYYPFSPKRRASTFDKLVARSPRKRH